MVTKDIRPFSLNSFPQSPKFCCAQKLKETNKKQIFKIKLKLHSVILDFVYTKKGV